LISELSLWKIMIDYLDCWLFYRNGMRRVVFSYSLISKVRLMNYLKNCLSIDIRAYYYMVAWTLKTVSLQYTISRKVSKLSWLLLRFVQEALTSNLLFSSSTFNAQIIWKTIFIELEEQAVLEIKELP